jgi:hypothetical protein
MSLSRNQAIGVLAFGLALTATGLTVFLTTNLNVLKPAGGKWVGWGSGMGVTALGVAITSYGYFSYKRGNPGYEQIQSLGNEPNPSNRCCII